MNITIEYIILTWNSEKYIANCLTSIFQVEGYQTKVHIVDNGSEDGTLNLINAQFPQVNLISLPTNQGTTQTRNMALKNISDATDYICILDSDTIINSNAIELLITTLKADSKCGIAIPSMNNRKGEYQHSCKRFPTLQLKILKALPGHLFSALTQKIELYDVSSFDFPEYVDYGISACWLMKKNCFDMVGYFDETFFYAPEDVDYCIRVWKNGYRVVYVPKANIVHDTQRISKKKFFSKHNLEHLKGLVYLFHKHRYCFGKPSLKA